MNIPQFIGEFYENSLAGLFNLERIDRNFSHKTADLFGKTFYVESKASRFDNGGVIKGWQLGELKKLNIECPYAFSYHELRTPVWKYYPTERSLKHALTMNPLKSLHIIPFSVVEARYKQGYKRPYRNTGDDFVQITENLAAKIFAFDEATWLNLHLNPLNYFKVKPKGTDNIFILCDNKQTLEALLSGFNLQAYRKIMRAKKTKFYQ